MKFTELKNIHLIAVTDNLYVSCAKCKLIEDTFVNGEIPNEYGWTYYRKKWYCKYCYNS